MPDVHCGTRASISDCLSYELPTMNTDIQWHTVAMEPQRLCTNGTSAPDAPACILVDDPVDLVPPRRRDWASRTNSTRGGIRDPQRISWTGGPGERATAREPPTLAVGLNPALTYKPRGVKLPKIAHSSARVKSFAKASPPATGSSGLQGHAAGSNRVQVTERLAEHRRQTGFGASLSGHRPAAQSPPRQRRGPGRRRHRPSAPRFGPAGLL